MKFQPSSILLITLIAFGTYMLIFHQYILIKSDFYNFNRNHFAVNLSTQNERPLLSKTIIRLNDCYNDSLCVIWKDQFIRKVDCISSSCGVVYLYHARKAGGSTLRQILEDFSYQLHIQFYETEGLVLNPMFLQPPGFMTFISVRDPIDRIISLYWYEHVLFFYGNSSRAKAYTVSTLHDWVDTWRDQNPWKQNHTLRNPRNNYIDIENYYVKLLVNWNGKFIIQRDHLEQAKVVLRQFDAIFITEWLDLPISRQIFSLLSNSSQSSRSAHLMAIDEHFIRRFHSTLAADEVHIRSLLRDINSYDIELFDYAQALVQQRAAVVDRMYAQKLAKPFVLSPLRKKEAAELDVLTNLRRNESIKQELFKEASKDLMQKYAMKEIMQAALQCANNVPCNSKVNDLMLEEIGCFRPNGHKQPVMKFR